MARGAFAASCSAEAGDRLCAYFDVSMGELFEFVPENQKRRKT